MCTKLVPITTVRPDFRQIVGGKATLVVPCGKCPECLSAKVKAIYQRCYLEYEHYLRNGDYAYWDTLTLNDDHLKFVDDVPYFPRKYITLALKRLRQYLNKLYPGLSQLVKFFLISENVSEGKHCRPHVHIIFYLPRSLNVIRFKHLLNQAWNRYGFTDSVYHTLPHVLNSPAAIKYVIKYIEKWVEYDSLDDDDENRLCKPFYQCSLNMGYYPEERDYTSYLRVLTHDGYEYQQPCLYYQRKTGVEMIRDPERLDKKGKPSPVLTENGSYTYKISDTGIYLKLKNFDTVIGQKVKQYYKLYSFLKSEYKEKVTDLMHCRSWEDLARYQTVYKGVRYSTLFDPPFKFKRILQDYCAILTCQNEQVYASPKDLALSPYCDTDVIRYLCDRDVPHCRGFDKVLDLLYGAKVDYCWSNHQRKLDKLHSFNRLKSCL